MDNSIRLKELQVVSGALRKGDERLGKKKCFPKGVFFGEEGRMDQFHPFPKEFFLRIGRSEFYLGWGLTQGFVSWVAWEGEIWLILKVGRWDLQTFQGIIFLVVWDGVVGKRGWVYFVLFFLSFVTW